MKPVAVQLHVGQMVAEVHVAWQKLQLAMGVTTCCIVNVNTERVVSLWLQPLNTLETFWGKLGCLSKLGSKQIEFKLTNDDTEK